VTAFQLKSYWNVVIHWWDEKYSQLYVPFEVLPCPRILGRTGTAKPLSFTARSMANLQGKKRAARIGDTNHPYLLRAWTAAAKEIFSCATHIHLAAFTQSTTPLDGGFSDLPHPYLRFLATPQMVSIPPTLLLLLQGSSPSSWSQDIFSTLKFCSDSSTCINSILRIRHRLVSFVE
jgi:hypothetical protein